MSRIFRKTKIVCTLGPASFSDETVKALIQAGMDVARLNFSHGDHYVHREIIRMVRRISRDFDKTVGMLQDLVRSAVNSALETAERMMKEKIESSVGAMTGGLLGKLFG